MRFLQFFLLCLLPLLTVTLAQSMMPSGTPVRRSPHPLPTSIDEVTDPELLAVLSDSKQVSRSRRRKIHGVGHEADQLPLSNAERMRMGLPLKPPRHKEKHPSADQPTEFKEDIGDWLEESDEF